MLSAKTLFSAVPMVMKSKKKNTDIYSKITDDKLANKNTEMISYASRSWLVLIVLSSRWVAQTLVMYKRCV